MKKRLKFVIALLVSTMTTLTGCGIGNMFFSHTKGGEVIDLENPELQNRYDRRPNDGSTPEDYTTEDNIKSNLYIAAGVLNETTYWNTTATGKVTASVGPMPYNQDVYSKRVVNNDDNKEWFFQTNTISTFVKKSEQRFSNPTSYLTRTGSNPTMTGATYTKDNIVGFTKDAYLERYGNTSNNLSNYVLNDYSVTSGKFISEENGLYKFSYILDPYYAAAKYMREVQFMSGASGYPSFSRTEVTITIDDSWRLYEVNSIDTYQVSIMGGLTCASDIVDVFTYSDTYQEIPEKEDFKDMFGTVGGDDTVSKSATDYLTEAAAPFMAPGDSPINLEANFNINNNNIPLYISVDLKNMLFRVSIDDQVFIYYKDQKAYLLCGEDLNFIVEQNELLDLVRHYIPDFAVDNVNLADLLEAEFFTTMMDTMTLEKEDGKAVVSMSGVGMSVGLNLNLDENDTASFESIDVSYNKDPLNVQGNIKLFTAEHSYIDIPSDIHELTNLSGLANSIDRFIEAKSVTGDINFDLGQNVTLKGTYTVDYNDNKHIKGQIDLDLTVNSELINITLLIDNSDLYFSIGDKIAKMTMDEASELIFELATNLLTNKVEIDSVTGALNSGFDIGASKNDIIPLLNKLIEAIETGDDGVKVLLDLTSYQFANGVELQYLYDSSLFNIEIEGLGSVTLIPGTKLNLDIPSVTNITSLQIQELVRMVLDYEEVRKVSFSLDYDKDNIVLDIDGVMDLNNLIAQGTISFNLDGVKGTGSFQYRNNEVLFTLADKIKAQLTPEQLIQLVDKVKGLLSSRTTSIPSVSTPTINSVSINSIISSINFDGDIVTMPFDLSILGIEGVSGIVNATISPLRNSLSLNYNGLVLNISLNRYPTFNEVTADDSYLDYNEFSEIIDGLFNVYDGYNNLSFNFDAKIEEQDYKGQGFITIDADNQKYTLSLVVNEAYIVNLIYEDGVAYLDLNGIKVKGEPLTVVLFAEQILSATNTDIPLLNTVLESLETGNFNFELILGGLLEILPKNNDINLEEVISSFTYSEKKLELDLLIEDKTISLSWDLNANSFAVTYDGISASLGYSEDNEELELDVNDVYLDLDPLADLKASTILNFVDFAKAGSYNINGAFTIAYEGTNISVTIKDSYLSIVDNNITAKLNIELGIYDSSYSITVYYVNDQVYLSAFDKIFVADSLEEIINAFAGVGVKPETPNIEVSSVIGLVFTKFNDIVKSIVVDNTGKEVAINLDLSSFTNEYISLTSATISYKESTDLVNINITGLGELSVAATTSSTVTVPSQEYLSIEDIKTYINSATELLNNKQFEITLDVHTSIAGKQVDISGTLIADLADKFDISFDGSIYFDGISSTVKLTKVGDTFYIDLGNVKVTLTTEEVFSLITKLNNDYKLNIDPEILIQVKDALSLLEKGQYQDLIALFSTTEETTTPEVSKPLDISAILTIVNSILDKLTVTKANIKIDQYDLSSYVEVLGTSSITISNSMNVTFTSGIGTITLAPTTTSIVKPSSNGYLDYNGILNILTLVNEVLDSNAVSYDFNFKKDEIKVDGNLYIKFAGFDSTISITGTYDVYNFTLTYINNRIYAEVNGAKIEIGYNEAIKLVSTILSSLDKGTTEISTILNSLSNKELPTLSTSTPKLDINSLISSFNYTNNILAITINNEYNVNLTLDSNISNINASYDGYSINLDRATASEVSAITGTLNLDSLSNVTSESIKDIISKLKTGIFNITLVDIKVSTTKLSELLGISIPTIVDEVSVSGTIYLDINTFSLQADLVVSYEGNVYNIVVTYVDEVIALDVFDTIYIKDSKENILNFIGGYVDLSSTSTPSTTVSQSSLIVKLLNNFNSIITGITGTTTGIEVSFNTEALGYAEIGKLKVNTTGVSIVTNNSGEVSLVATASKSLATSSNEYLAVKDINKYIDSITSLIENKKASITLDIHTSIAGKQVDISGTLIADLKDKFDISFDGSIYFDGISSTVKLVKVGDTFYIDLGNVKVTLTTEEVFSLITKLNSDYKLNLDPEMLIQVKDALSLFEKGQYQELVALFSTTEETTTPEVSKPLDISAILNIVNGILDRLTVTKANIKIDQYDLSSYVAVLGTSSITISNSMNITFTSGLGTITLAPTTIEVTKPSTNGYLDYNGILNILTLVNEVLDSKALSYDFNFKKDEIKVDGNLYIKFAGFDSTISITGTYDVYNFTLTYINNRIYAEVNGAKIEIGYTEAIKLVSTILSSLDKGTTEISTILNSLSNKELPTLSTSTPKLDINSLISSFSYTNNILAITINNEYNVNLTLDSNISNINASYNGYSINLDRATAQDVSAITGTLNLDSLSNVTSESIKEIISKLKTGIFNITLVDIKVSTTKLSELLGISIPAIVDEVSVSGTIYLDINTFSLQADLVVSYEGNVYNIVVTYVDEVIALDVFDTIYIKDSKENILNFIGGYVDLSSTSTPSTTVSQSSLIIKLLNNFNSIITGITGTSTGIEVSFNTEALGYAEIGKLKVNTTGVSIVTNNSGEVSLVATPSKSLATSSNEYLAVKDINKYIDSITSLIDNKKASITLDVHTSIAGKQVDISGTLIADLADKFDISFDGSIYFDGISSTVKLVKVGDTFYIDLGNVKVTLTTEEVFSLITKLNNDYKLNIDPEMLIQVKDALSLLEKGQYQDLIALFSSSDSTTTTPTESKPVDVTAILTIVNSILDKLTVTKANIKIDQYDLSSYVAVLGTSSITISNSMNITFTSGLGTITLAPTTIEVTKPSTNGYLDYNGILNILTLVNEVLDSEALSYDFNFKKDEIKVDGNLYIKFAGFDSTISIAGTYDVYNFTLTYINNRIYAEVNGAKIEIGYTEAIKLVSTVLSSLDKGTTEISTILNSLSNKELPVLSTSTPKLDINSLISSFSYTNNVLAITINNEYNVNLTLDSTISNINASYDGYSINLDRATAQDVAAITGTLNLDSLSNVSAESIKEIISKLKTGIFNITLVDIKVSTTKLSELLGISIPAIVDEVSVSGTIYLDINTFSLQADLVVSYEGNVYNIVVTYVDEVIALDVFDTIYIKDSKENILNFIGGYVDLSSTSTPSTTVSQSSLIIKLLNNFNSIITGITGTSTGIEVSFNTEALGYAEIGKLKVNTTGVSIVTNNSGEVSLTWAEEKVVALPSKLALINKEVVANDKYVTIAEIDNYINSVNFLFDSKKYEFTFDMTLPKEFGGYDVSGDVKADINNKFDFEVSNLMISSPDFNVSLTLTKVGENFYFDLGTVQFVLSIDDLVKVMSRLEVEFKLDFGDIDLNDVASALKTLSSGDLENGLAELLNIFAPASSTDNNGFDIDKFLETVNIFDVISGIKFNKVDSGNDYISLDTDLSMISYMLGEISLKVYSNTGTLSLYTNSVIKSVQLSTSDDIVITAPVIDSDWNNAGDVNSIIDKVGDVVSFLQKKQFSLSADGVIKTNGVDKYSYTGSVKVDLSDSKNLKASFNATVNQLDASGNTTRTHTISVILENNTIYLVYNTNLRAYLTVKELLQLVRYITDVMNIKSDLLSSLLDGVTEGIGTGVFQPVVPEMKPLDLNINKLLKSLAVNENEDGTLGDLLIELDAEQMYTNLSGFNPNADGSTTNSIINAAISTSAGMMNSIKVKNIYSQSGEIFDINVYFDDIYSSETDLGIAAPSNLDSYYDFNTITALVKTFFNSADIASYSIDGNLELKLTIPVIDWFTSYQKLPLRINIELDENSVPTVHAQLYSDSDVKVSLVKIFNRGTADIYYDGHTQTIYVKRAYGYKGSLWQGLPELTGYKYGTYTVADLADPNKLGEMITLILQAADLVSNAIKDNMTGGSMEVQNPILFENVLSSYSSSYADNVYKYNMTISGSSLIKDDQLDDISLEFRTLHSMFTQDDGTAVEKDYLSYLYVATEVMGMIGLKVYGNLTNVHSDAAPDHVDVSIPSGAINGESNW